MPMTFLRIEKKMSKTTLINVFNNYNTLYFCTPCTISRLSTAGLGTNFLNCLIFGLSCNRF